MFWCFYWSLTRDNDFILAEEVTLLSQTQKQEGAPSPGVKPGQTTRPEREERSGVSCWIIKCQFPFFLFLSCELLLLINCWSGHKDNYALIVFRSDKQKNKSEGRGNNRNRKRDFHLTVQRVDDIQPHVWTHFCPGAILRASPWKRTRPHYGMFHSKWTQQHPNTRKCVSVGVFSCAAWVN